MIYYSNSNNDYTEGFFLGFFHFSNRKSISEALFLYLYSKFPISSYTKTIKIPPKGCLFMLRIEKGNRMLWLIMVFLLLQPVIDVLTSLSIRLNDQAFTLGLAMRFGFLLFICVYLLLASYVRKPVILGYSLLFCLFVVLSIGVQFTMKPVFMWGPELKWLLKNVYFVGCFLFFLVVFRRGFRISPLFYLMLAVILTGAIMTVAGLSNTAFASYDYWKSGHVGWFYAGNEIGAILAMGLPVVLYFALKGSWWLMVGLLMVMYGLLALGTKVGYGAILITLLIGICTSIVLRLVKREYIQTFKFVTLSILFVVFILLTPYTPVAHNMELQLDWLGVSKEEGETPVMTSAQQDNIIYSGRETYWEDYQAYFQAAPWMQKLFGMGYGGNFTDEAKTIEMDFLDLFYSLGIIGFSLYLLPFIYMLWQLIKQVFQNRKQMMELEVILVLTGIALGLGIAFIAGHVLTAPGVSIYLAVLMAWLTCRIQYVQAENSLN